MERPIRTFLLCLLAAVAVQPSGAQPAEVSATGVAYHSFLRTGEVPIEVFVMGEVRNSGVYAVGLGTELDQILALAGGTAVEGVEGGIARSVVIRHYRAQGGSRVLSYEQPLDRMLARTPPLPTLEDGDTVVAVVDTKQAWLTFDTALRVLTAVASVVLLVDRLTANR